MMGHVTYGDPSDPAIYMGPLISERQRDKVDGMVQRAVAAGATLVTGGKKIDPGFFYTPTLLSGVDPDSELAQEEVFGPVCAVMRADDSDAAVVLANGVRHGLVTAVFTRDLDRVIDLAGRLDTGLVRINQPTSGVDLHTPFGGEKESGLGPREQGKAAREFYTSLRTVLISPSC
jgi:aldehyde dehydrogenase (NAD+)